LGVSSKGVVDIMNILTRSCPCCGKGISFTKRLVLLKHEPLICKYCAKALKPNNNITTIHSFIIGFIISWSVKHYTELGFIWVISLGLFAIIFLQPIVDMLFSLEEDNAL
jgi:hypothetical protein